MNRKRIGKWTRSAVMVALLALIAGCATGEKALKQGNYDKAVFQATKRLKSDTDNVDALLTLRNAYPTAQRKHLQNIDFAKRSSDRFKWEGVARGYNDLNELADAIRSTPAAQSVVPNAVFYVDELNDAREQAAAKRYEVGESLLARGDHASGREAVDHFSMAERMMPGYRDVRAKLAVAREQATVKVVINPIACATRDIDVVFIENSMRTFLNDYRPGEFVRFYSAAEAQASGIATPDQIVDMKFDGFAIGQSKVIEKSQEVRKDNVVIGQTRSIPPLDVVGSVKATVITHKKTVSSNAQLDFQIRDGRTGRVLRHKKLPGSYVWEHEWGTFRGDERAVPGNLKRIVNQNDAQPPGRQELFVGFAEPIFQQACGEMRDFYQRYR